MSELALSEWGQWDDGFDLVDLALLQGAYVRRKRFEARLIALEVVGAMGGSMGAGRSRRHPLAGPSVSASGRPITRMSAEGLLAHMGAKMQ